MWTTWIQGSHIGIFLGQESEQDTSVPLTFDLMGHKRPNVPQIDSCATLPNFLLSQTWEWVLRWVEENISFEYLEQQFFIR